MIATLIGEPGENERDAEIAEAARGIVEAEEFLRVNARDTQIQDVGRGIREILNRGSHMSIGGFAASGNIMPRKGHAREVAPGVYYLS